MQKQYIKGVIRKTYQIKIKSEQKMKAEQKYIYTGKKYFQMTDTLTARRQFNIFNLVKKLPTLNYLAIGNIWKGKYKETFH